MRVVASPNFGPRAHGSTIDYIVLHATCMNSAKEALDRLCAPHSGVSAHYFIDEDGATIRLVDEKARAHHAGLSFWKGETDINSSSIGIELVNPGHAFGYRPFPAPQIAALKDLLRDITRRHHLGPSCLLAHSDIAPTRKADPGELFPWKDLADEGFGLWPRPTEKDGKDASESVARELLGAIGYECADLSAAVAAFQRRYRPSLFDGVVDAQSFGLMRALVRLL